MKNQRIWVTPLVAATFLVVGGTGVAMFFHASTSLGRAIHEWLGWGVVVAAVLHMVINWGAMKSYLGRNSGKIILGAAVAALVFSFIPLQAGSRQGNPMWTVITAVSQTRLHDVAPLAHRDVETIVSDLRKAGFASASAESTIESLAGPDQGKRFLVMGTIFQNSDRDGRP